MSHEPIDHMEQLVDKWHRQKDKADLASAKAYHTLRQIQTYVQDMADELLPGVIKNWLVYDPGGWECEDKVNNPFFNCVYDDREDPVHDDCLFCHQPEERK